MFNRFYEICMNMLDTFYPMKTVSTTNRDPYFVTPQIKILLRKRNKLMRRNKIEAANSITARISKMIVKTNSATFAESDISSKELWEKVRTVTGSNQKKQCRSSIPTVNADSLNSHYAGISRDSQYTQPTKKPTQNVFTDFFGEFEVFKLLDTVKPTSAGLDSIPHWFLRVAAPFLYQPITFIFNQSISFSYIPEQWKLSIITPVPKSKQPEKCSDFRPISVTSVLCRLLERLIIRKFLYPVLIHPNHTGLFKDQFAFRPTGSTTAAIINLVHKISLLLQDHEYVHLIGLDFSKAFDSVRHSTLIQKLAQFPIPACVHNWFIEYLDSRQHCTKFNSIISAFLEINASFVQGSVIGPTAYVCNASDLHPVHAENSLNKFADDTYLIAPSSNSHTVPRELEHISEWAHANNLILNTAKSMEMIIHKPRTKLDHLSVPPPPGGISRVTSMKILGVTMTDSLSFEPHVSNVVARCAQTGYALRILRAHGLNGLALWNVTRATLVSKLLYASPAWFGFLDEGSKGRCQGVIRKCIRTGYLNEDFGSFAEQCENADDGLFRAILGNNNHVLHQLLPPIKNCPYALRPRVHNHELPAAKNNSLRKNFMYRMLYKNTY